MPLKSRPPSRRIIDIDTDPRDAVNLSVAACFLRLNWRTVRARIDEGKLAAIVDGKVYRITLDALRDYQRRFHGKQTLST